VNAPPAVLNIETNKKLNNQELNSREFILDWLIECFKYLLDLRTEKFKFDYLNKFNLDLFLASVREFGDYDEDAVAFTEFLIDNLNELYKENFDERLFQTRILINYKCKACSSVFKGHDECWSIWRLAIENFDVSC
jgi:hypothetical protein